MAEDEVPDDIDLDDLLKWVYVDDDYTLADELAESQIPDPGYVGAGGELELNDYDDFDVFDYWDDLNYGDEAYWDHGGTAGSKRRRIAGNPPKLTAKRRKLKLHETGGGSVRFMGFTARWERRQQRKRPSSGPTFALLPDWRERFAHTQHVLLNKEMPAEMRKAAEAGHDDELLESPNDMEQGGTEEDDEEQDLQATLASLDPEMLRSILREKLGAAGLEGMDESAFMQTIGRMLSGEEGADAATGTLADNLLNQASEGNDATLSGWLTQQGVSFETDDEEAQEAETTVVRPVKGHGRSALKNEFHSSPADSVMDASNPAGRSTAEAALHTSSPLPGTKKRAAQPTEEDEAPSKMRRVTSQHQLQPQQNGEPQTATKEKSVANLADSDAEASEDTVDKSIADATNVQKRRSTQVDSSKEISITDQVAPSTKPETQADAGEESSKTTMPARNTRKRKGRSADGDAEDSHPKKQARKVSGPAEAVGKRTRSTRAAAKAEK